MLDILAQHCCELKFFMVIYQAVLGYKAFSFFIQ
jgi:hypothetical protein